MPLESVLLAEKSPIKGVVPNLRLARSAAEVSVKSPGGGPAIVSSPEEKENGILARGKSRSLDQDASFARC